QDRLAVGKQENACRDCGKSNEDSEPFLPGFARVGPGEGVPHPGGQGGNQPRHGSSLAPGLSRGWTPVYAEWHGDATRGDLLSRNAMRGGRTWLEELGKVSEQLSIEPSPVEAQRVAAQQLRIERLSLLLKGLHRRDQAIDLLLGKPHAGRRISAVQVRDR